TGEHQQIFVVAAHPGGQVVELEELGETLGVLLSALDRVELADHPVDQRLRAPGQAEEHRRDAGTQGSLFGRDPYRLPVYRVEGRGHLPDLVPAVDRHRVFELRDDLIWRDLADLAYVPHPGDRVGQLPADHRHRAFA